MNDQTDNDIVYVAGLHWVLFVWPVLLAIGGMLLGIYIEQLLTVSIFLVLFALAWGAMTWVTFHFSSLTIKSKQVILRTGMLVRNTIDIPMAKIESIDIRQSILGSLLRYGSLVITGTGGTRQMVNYLNKPLTCRRYIEQSMHG